MAMDAAAGGGALVLDTLRQACSQEANVLKPAEQQLKEWETQPGFYSILSVSGCWSIVFWTSKPSKITPQDTQILLCTLDFLKCQFQVMCMHLNFFHLITTLITSYGDIKPYFNE